MLSIIPAIIQAFPVKNNTFPSFDLLFILLLVMFGSKDIRKL